jgi:hypothetical protein
VAGPLNGKLSYRRARFRRNGCNAFKGYIEVAMIHFLDIDLRIARHCLRAGRLHSGV